jgi:ABC-2 type transport system permease protein
MVRAVESTTIVSPGPLSLRPRKVGTLFRLRLKLWGRSFSGSGAASRIIGVVLLFLFLMPLAIGGTIGLVSAFGYLLPADIFHANNVLFYILFGLYFIWTWLPLVQFSVNEGLDITKLRQYPLTRLEIMSGLLFSTLLDIPTLAVIVLFIGILIGWSTSLLSAILLTGILLLAYIHSIGLSQLLLMSLLGALQSRRWRDLSLVLFAAFGMSCSLIFQLIPRLGIQNADGLVAFFNYDIGSWLQFLPPGMAVRAISAIYTGDFLWAIIWSLFLLVALVPLFWAWGFILDRALASSEESSGQTRKRRQQIKSSDANNEVIGLAAVPGGRVFSFLPLAVQGILIKDLRYFWRDPQFKRIMITTLYWVGLIIVFSLQENNNRTPTQIGGYFIYLAVLFTVLSLSMNMFGYEGAAITTLGLFPVRPSHLFIGKNIAVFVFSSIQSAIILVVITAFHGSWSSLPISELAVLEMLIIGMGLGNIFAIFFPVRVVRAARLGRAQADAGSNFGSALMRFFASFLVMILAAPIGVVVTIGQDNNFGTGVLAVFIGLGLVYSLTLYGLGTALAASFYYKRLPEVISVVARE